MFGVHKQFSRSLHKGNDPQSRRVVKEFFQKRGITLNDNPNEYGIDLVSPDGTLMVEVEHRLPWTDEEFPFAEINIPERKAKFLRDGKCQYVILSCNFSRMGIVRGPDVQPFITDDNLAHNPNKYVRNGEYFYKVPRTAFKWVTV